MPENNTWRKIIARNPGVCVICQEEIIVGEDIQNNSDQRINRHQKCVKELHELDKQSPLGLSSYVIYSGKKLNIF